MKTIQRYLFYFTLWFFLFITFIIYNGNQSSQTQIIINTGSNDLNGLSITGLQQPLMTGRRNHACLTLNNSILVNIAGRDIHSTEFQDLHSGVIKGVYNKRLDIHHHVALLHNGEIWLPCGLSRNNRNYETSLEYMLIVNIETGNVRQGPKLRFPCASCGAVIVSKMIINKDNIQRIVDDGSLRVDLNISKWTEDVICILGGSIGQHDTSTFTNHVECYSERGKGWIMLPNLPMHIDHLVAHIYTRPFDNEDTVRDIPTEWHEDQVIAVIGGRTEYDYDDRREIFTMSLSDGYWNRAAEMVEQRSGFASCIFDNRYIIVAGGISYREPEGSKPLIFSQIEVCDMSTKKCRLSNARLQKSRFDTTGCSINDLCYVCGGTTQGTDDIHSCETFMKHDLLDIVG